MLCFPPPLIHVLNFKHSHISSNGEYLDLHKAQALGLQPLQQVRAIDEHDYLALLLKSMVQGAQR